jgi:hypothetical protein
MMVLETYQLLLSRQLERRGAKKALQSSRPLLSKRLQTYGYRNAR